MRNPAGEPVGQRLARPARVLTAIGLSSRQTGRLTGWRAVRPSGNAPQLRIYANSDSQGRADQIVELGLREPDGILRQLARAFTQGPVTTSR